MAPFRIKLQNIDIYGSVLQRRSHRRRRVRAPRSPSRADATAIPGLRCRRRDGDGAVPGSRGGTGARAAHREPRSAQSSARRAAPHANHSPKHNPRYPGSRSLLAFTDVHTVPGRDTAGRSRRRPEFRPWNSTTFYAVTSTGLPFVVLLFRDSPRNREGRMPYIDDDHRSTPSRHAR